MPATAENMLKVTDRLLSAKPDLLPEYATLVEGLSELSHVCTRGILLTSLSSDSPATRREPA